MPMARAWTEVGPSATRTAAPEGGRRRTAAARMEPGRARPPRWTAVLQAERPDEPLELLGGAGELLRRRGDLLRRGAGLLRGGRDLLASTPRTARRPRRPRSCRSGPAASADAICWIAAAICSTRPFMSCDGRARARGTTRGPARPSRRRPRCGGRRPRRPRRPCAVSPWISAMSAAIDAAADWDSSASLRTSSATTAKPRPCSPARAASMAAFSASRFVCSAMPVIVSTMPADLLGLGAELADRLGRVAASCRAPRSSPRWPASTAPAPCSATSRAVTGGVGASPARSARSAELADATSSVASLACSTARTWRSAPWATSPTAEAISPTARPASSEVVAICCEAADSDCAEPDTLPTSSRKLRDHASRRRCRGRRASSAAVTLDGQVAVRDALGDAGAVVEVVDHAAERVAQLADLVVALDVDMLVDVALGDAARRPPAPGGRRA